MDGAGRAGAGRWTHRVVLLVLAFLVVGAAVAAVASSVGDDDAGAREVPFEQLRGIEAAVVMAPGTSAADLDRVRDLLDDAAGVERYTVLPDGIASLQVDGEAVFSADGYRAALGDDRPCRAWESALLVDLDATADTDPLGALRAELPAGLVDQVAGLAVIADGAPDDESPQPSVWRQADVRVTARISTNDSALRALADEISALDDVAEVVAVPGPGAVLAIRLATPSSEAARTVARAVEDEPAVERVEASPLLSLAVADPIGDAEVDAEVFVQLRAPRATRDAIGDEVAADPLVDEVELVDRRTALDEFRERFADRPEIADAVSEQLLPESFRVVLRAGALPEDRLAFAERIEALDGVDAVSIAPERGRCAG